MASYPRGDIKKLRSVANGDVVFKVYPLASAVSLSAAALNVAAADSVTQTVTIRLEDSAGRLLDMFTGFNLGVTIDVGNSSYAGAADPTPTISDTTPAVVNGICTFDLELDTNTEVTELVYTEDDVIAIAIAADVTPNSPLESVGVLPTALDYDITVLA